MSDLSLPAQLEAVMFASATPTKLAYLARVTSQPVKSVRAALVELDSQLQDRGIALAYTDDQYQLVTSPLATKILAAAQPDATNRDLSAAALETLGLIAYRGPLTKHQIDSHRGVSSDSILRSLQARDLIAEFDRSTEPGRPIRYHTTANFLAYFGLTSLAQLPPLPEDQEDINDAS